MFDFYHASFTDSNNSNIVALWLNHLENQKTGHDISTSLYQLCVGRTSTLIGGHTSSQTNFACLPWQLLMLQKQSCLNSHCHCAHLLMSKCWIRFKKAAKQYLLTRLSSDQNGLIILTFHHDGTGLEGSPLKWTCVLNTGGRTAFICWERTCDEDMLSLKVMLSGTLRQKVSLQRDSIESIQNINCPLFCN